MSQLNGRRVTVARVHVPVHFKDVGSLASPITEDSFKNKGSLKMTRVDGGLIIAHNLNEIFIPDGNIQSLQLAPEAPAQTFGGVVLTGNGGTTGKTK